MKTQQSLSAHCTDEQLIANFYGVGPQDGHLEACDECQARTVLLDANRQSIEAARGKDELADFEFLAAQRRAIYEKLEQPMPWWLALSVKRWASVAATALVLVGGAAVYQEQRVRPVNESPLSDAQLAQEVSTMSQEYEAQPTAPLQGLFE